MYQILIAEDELMERMMLKKMLLKRFGDFCEIIEAENGKEALELFNHNRTDIAILDIEMPGINGMEAAEEMRREKSGLFLIFLTAYGKLECTKQAVAAQAMEYLLKPYSEKELVNVTQKALYSIEKARSFQVSRKREMIVRQESSPSRLNVLVSMIEEYIRSNYMYDISLQEAARAVNYSEPYFCKMFKKQFGQNFTAYLTEYRLKEAKKFLSQPNIRIKDIGIKVGYPDSSYFAKVFRRMTGISPSEYRKEFLKKSCGNCKSYVKSQC